MKYLLDTNVCIKYLNEDSMIRQKLVENIDLEAIAVCSVVKLELFYGAMRSDNPDQVWAKVKRFLEVFISLHLDDISALNAGKIRAQLANAGTHIGYNDLLIASIALSHDLILVTHNTKEFVRVEGLKIEDWEIE
ncbi:virulence-associated protein VapC [Calothrix sp. NIES-2100]|uniref:type II toxin-antitoxin system VapC family toxin n=1 Tax=Calothrix sp. NIES-2100 TaxID=1954172 RepID=UPI000B607E54|nr:virulence-associated protein VapC [Calothrix sp. NIES-2100]